MKKTRVGKWIAAIGASLMFLFAFLFSVGGGILTGLPNDGESGTSSDKITAEAATVNSNYDMLVNGSSYYYSDVTKITAFRAGTADTDASSTLVNTSSDHGTAVNPYVINTVDQWNYFAGDTTNATKTSNVFVLGSDLDFSGKTFKPVPSLGAKFYGANHILKNISYNFNAVASSNTSGNGLFITASQSAVITDVSLKNVTFTNVYAYAGFICGKSNASILNCHVHGKITGNAVSNCGIGGIVGNVQNNSARVYIYRCSVFADFNLHCGAHGGVGGICGDADNGAGLSVYDCLVINNYNFHTGTDAWFGGIFDITNINTGTATHELQNCIAYSNIKDTATDRRAEGSLFQGWGSNAVTVNCKNTYTAGKLTGTRGNANAVYDLYGGLYHNPNVSNCTVTASNVNWYAQNPYALGNVNQNNATTVPLDVFASHSVATTRWNGSAGRTRADMWAAMVNDVSFSDKIWINKSVINDAYMTNTNVTSTTGYSITESPVRNPLKITVSYYNYTTSGDDQYRVNDSLEPQVVKAGESLFEPALPENRIFMGWTTDKTGKETPFKAVPSNMLGDNKLYAVWKIDQTKVDITATGTGMTGDSTDGYELVYNGNGGTKGITLTANLTAAGMSDPEITYQWSKGGSKIESGGTAKTFKVENVPDSGDYTVEVKFASKSEPLFTGTAETVTATKATVKPAPLTYRGVTFKEGDHPYSGAPYDTAVPDAVIVNADGIRVDGTTQWTIDLGKFNDKTNPGAVLADGKETKEILFKPDSKYNGNYGASVPFDATFDIEFLKFIFSIPRINDMTLEVNLEYGQHYTYNNVVTMFEEAFKPYLGNLAGNTPAFVVNGQPVKINDYRKLGTGGSTTAYADVKQSYTIEVAFVPQSYTVTYDARNEGVNTYDPVTVGHGIRLAKPADPTYGNQLFLGWFYEATDDIGNKSEVAWNFDSDRVTQTLELYAKWLNADTLADLEVVISPIAKFVAKEELDPSMLTVTAVYEGTAEGQTLRQKSVLTSDQYTIEYEDGKSALHAKADNSATTVTISYTFKGQTISKTLTLNVEKLKVDTSKLKKYFKDTAVVATGAPQSMREIDSARISTELPEISGCTVTYKYYNSSEDEITDLSLVKDIGTYYVRAYFEPRDVDYDAPYIQAKFQIVPEKIKLTVDWGETEFVYNGKAQAPTPTFTDMTDPEHPVVVAANYSLKLTRGTEEITEAIKARSDYFAELNLEDLAYELEGEATKAFVIKQAVLPVPTQIKPFPYRGSEYNLNTLSAADLETYFEGFDLSFMEVKSGEGIRGDKGKDASRYNAIVLLKDPDSARFEDGTSQATMGWQIEKAKLTVDWNSYEFYANNGIQTPKVIVFYEFYGEDADLVDYTADIEYSGDINAMQSGEYSITVIVKPEAAWAKNYELDNSKTCAFVILPKAGMEVITIVWDTNTLFEYNGGVQRPTFKVLNRVGADITDQIQASEFRWNEDAQTSKWAGDYSAEVTMRPGSNYFLTGNTSCLYTITKNANGEGAKPDDSGNNGGTVGPGPSENTNELPIWQLIVGGISAILFVVCSAKAFGEYGKYKAAKKEAKELAQVSYSVTYGFAPLPLMAISFLGLGETPWTIIAFAALGLFLVSLAALLVLSKKRKAAELVVKREQARIEEEKEYARQDREEQIRAEQQRRDEEFKMMFAAMQQNSQQSQVGYNDMQNLISTVSALLPGLQQSMQALPPAQAPDQYAAPAPDQYGAPAPSPQYGHSEADELRAQMAAQQQRMEAQMAQQQELINQLLQNQQVAQQAAPAAVPQEAPVQEEAFWTVEGEEIVSLEELYGKLSDDAKRGYYEIGSYIMNKPQTSQNDGKYAVLFKYRGKTLFKLCIKNDAPVLYYPAENGGRAEVLIVDAAALEVAKSIVDVHIAKTDSEMA